VLFHIDDNGEIGPTFDEKLGNEKSILTIIESVGRY
jgi:hypothetical protein